MTDKPPFSPGQKLVRKFGTIRGYRYNKSPKLLYGAEFTVHIVEQINGEWIVLDIYLNKHRAEDCMDAAAYNSPLWRAMQEDEP